MKKVLIFWAFFCLTTAAHAWSCLPKTILLPTASGVNFTQGYAEVHGVKTYIRTWWCPGPNGTWIPESQKNVQDIQITGDQLLDLMDQWKAAPNTLAAVNAAASAAFSSPLPSEVPSWNAAAASAAAMLSATRPVPMVVPGTWAVPPTGSRSLFTFSGGKLTGLVSGRTAKAGAACDCTASMAVVGGKTYCALVGAVTTEVAVCVRQ